MNTGEKSLHLLVQKWLAPMPTLSVRVVKFGRTRKDNTRYVHVEVLGPNGSHTMVFFRHDDRCWCVFPPQTMRPSMNAYRLAA